MPFPKTEMPGGLQAQLSQRGIRMTQQRRAILQVIETADRHLDASQLLRRARKNDASVDRATVYRTLSLLKKQGLIDELDLMHTEGDKHYYERRTGKDHIHVTCLRCGNVTEFQNDHLERLKSELQSQGKFHIVVTRLEIGGYCQRCSK